MIGITPYELSCTTARTASGPSFSFGTDMETRLGGRDGASYAETLEQQVKAMASRIKFAMRRPSQQLNYDELHSASCALGVATEILEHCIHIR